AAVAALTGPIQQAPSAVSAIKVDGRRAYDRVRAGESVELKKRSVTIRAFETGELRAETVIGSDGETVEILDLDATVRCSSGTYVRALARDLGAELGVGGHLTALRRTEVGPFDVTDAVTNSALADGAVDAAALLEPAAVASRLFPTIALDAQQEIDLGHGKRLRVDPELHPDAELSAAIAPNGRLVGLVEVVRGRTRVVTNFPVPESAA
ncbi:tRNA pseudouridine(55) synthase TruB, partial [Leucobacter soli]